MHEDHLVKLAIHAWHGDFEEIVRLADACGFEPEWDGNTLHIHGLVRTALPKHADPVTAFVVLGFAFIGGMWAHACPNGLKKVNKIWKEEMKADKVKKE